MLRLCAPFLPVLFALLAALLPVGAAAGPIRFDVAAELDRRVAALHILPIVPKGQVRALPRLRLLTKEIIILPSGRMITRSVAARDLARPMRRPEFEGLSCPSPPRCRFSSQPSPASSSQAAAGPGRRALQGARGRSRLGRARRTARSPPAP